jgi:acetyl esterase
LKTLTKPFVRPDVQAFLDLREANPGPALTAGNIAEMRALASRGMMMLDVRLGDLDVTRDFVMPGPGGDIALRLFDTRASREPGPAVVFFHGGGFVMGNIDTHASICAEIARRLDLPVISVDYRLAPEHPWPAAPDDAEAAARWIATNGVAFDRDITGLVLSGDSAGGNLAIVTGLALRDRPAAVPVILQMMLYPMTDPLGHYPSNDAFSEGYLLDAAQTRWFVEQYKPDPRHWRAAPAHADLRGSPPTLVVTAELDPLRDQGHAYATKLVAAGARTTYREVTGTIHGFAGYRRLIPSAQDDLVGALASARMMMQDAELQRATEQ